MPWTDEEKELYSETERSLADDLRMQLKDDNAARNHLDAYQQHYTNAELIFYIRRAVKDINRETPHTNYTVDNFPVDHQDLLITGGMIFAFVADGVLQLRNQIDYSDAGLSLSMFNKSSLYDQKVSFYLQIYLQDRKEFKRGVLANSVSAGFYGIASPFHPNWGRYGRY